MEIVDDVVGSVAELYERDAEHRAGTATTTDAVHGDTDAAAHVLTTSARGFVDRWRVRAPASRGGPPLTRSCNGYADTRARRRVVRHRCVREARRRAPMPCSCSSDQSGASGIRHARESRPARGSPSTDRREHTDRRGTRCTRRAATAAPASRHPSRAGIVNDAANRSPGAHIGVAPRPERIDRSRSSARSRGTRRAAARTAARTDSCRRR